MNSQDIAYYSLLKPFPLDTHAHHIASFGNPRPTKKMEDVKEVPFYEGAILLKKMFHPFKYLSFSIVDTHLQAVFSTADGS